MKICKETLLGGGRKLFSLWLCSLALAACTDTLDEAAVPKPLSVAVNARDITARAPIHGTALPDASNIGISLVAEDGTPYDGVTYDNLKYTAAGTAPDQSWSTPNVPTLSSSPAKLVAYYPWAENTDYSAVPVETGTQTDYMYSQWLTGLSNANNEAYIVMKHALTAVRVALVKGDFTADVDVSSVSVKSPAFATAGAMDATTGALSALTGIGDAVTVTADFPLTAQATNVEVMAVPDVSVLSGVTTVTTQIGDRKYSVNINFTESYKQGYIYTYTLTLNNTGMEVTSVAVTPWEEGTADNGDLAVDNDYIVKIAVPSDGYTFTHNLYNFTGTIDWGDGSTTTVGNSKFPTHTYQTAGEYTVTAKGVATSLSNYDNNTYSVKEDCFTELVYIGKEMGLINMSDAFYYSNLNKIHEGALDGCTKVTDFGGTFMGTKITEIPAGLFDKCTEVEVFGGSCTYGVFCGCIYLTNIPEGLFDNCTKVQYFNSAFQGTAITEIPEGLFDNCPEVTEFSQTFMGCTKLKSIPEGLFDNNTKVVYFGWSGGGGDGTFDGCTALTSIPEGLFDKCTEVVGFAYLFHDCTGLTSIPQGLFDKCIKATNFVEVFSNCTGLTGESPYTTIKVDGSDVKVHLYERASYSEHFTTPTNFGYAFYECTGLTDYANIPAEWK